MFHRWRYIPSQSDSHNLGIKWIWIKNHLRSKFCDQFWVTLFIPRDLGINLNSQHVSIYKSIAIDNICIQVAVYIICPLLVLTVFGTVNYCKVVNPYIGLKLCWLQQQVNNVSVQSYRSSHCNILTTLCPRCLWPADFCQVTRWLTYYQTVNNKNILLS